MIKLIKKIVTNVVAAVKDVYAKTSETAAVVKRNVALVPRAIAVAVSVTADTVSIELSNWTAGNPVSRALRDVAVVAVWMANVVVQFCLFCATVMLADFAADMVAYALVQYTPVVAWAVAGGSLCVLALVAVYFAVKVSVFLVAVKFSLNNTSASITSTSSYANAHKVITSVVKWLDTKSINLGTFFRKLFDRICSAVIDAVFDVSIRVGMFVLSRVARRKGIEVA